MSPRPRLTDAETSEYARQLIEATFRLVATTGDADPPVRDILREASLGRQAFYRCFASKDELMSAVLEEGLRRLTEYLRARMARARTPEDQVRAWVSGLMRQAQAATERTRPFILASGSVPDPDAHTHLSALLTDAIAAGVEDGTFASTDPRADAEIVHDYVFASMRQHLARDERPTRDTIQRLADFAVRGLSPAATRSAR